MTKASMCFLKIRNLEHFMSHIEYFKLYIICPIDVLNFLSTPHSCSSVFDIDHRTIDTKGLVFFCSVVLWSIFDRRTVVTGEKPFSNLFLCLSVQTIENLLFLPVSCLLY